MARKLTDGLTLRANGTYELVRRIDGKQKSFSSKNPREVWRKYNEYLRASDEKREELQRGRSFAAVADEWWQGKQREIAYGTTRCYKPAYERAVQTFGAARVGEVEPNRIDAFLVELGQKSARNTVANQLSVLNMIFRYAVLKGYCKGNPCQYVSVPPHLAHKTRQLLTPEQLKAVKGSSGQPCSLLALLILYTGARCGEALALQWKDVDFAGHKISITKAVVFHGNAPVIEKPKTAAGVRAVPLLTALETLLRPLADAPERYLIGGEKPLSKSALNRYWERYTKSLGLGSQSQTGDPWKPSIDRHQIRHEYATMLYEAGVDVLAAKTIMGHTDIATTQKIYTHIRESRLDDARTKLEELDQR